MKKMRIMENSEIESWFGYSARTITESMDDYGIEYVLMDEDGETYFSNDGESPLVCPECGNPIWATGNDDVIEYGGELYHEDCGAYCDDCGAWTPYSEMTELYNGNSICPSCLEEYTECAGCGEYAPTSDMYEGDDGNLYCPDCASSYYFCDNCGVLLVDSDNRDRHGDHYCDECRDCGDFGNENIADYHCGRRSVFISTGSTHDRPFSKNSYIGLEMEFENLSEDFGDEVPEWAKAEWDCSVADGFELISDAMTFKYWKQSVNVEYFINTVTSFNGESGESAGIHLNLSTHNIGKHRIANIIRFISQNWDSLIKFGRRPRTNGRYYEQPASYDDDSDLIHNCQYHTCGANTSHKGRIELRFFNSSTDADHIWAIVEFGHCLMELAKSDSDINWNDIIDFAKKDGDCQHLIKEYDNNFESEERDYIIANA